MANVMNPLNLAWQHANKFTDGSALGAAQYVGTELSLDGKAAVSIPVAWATDGHYTFPVASVGALTNATHTWAIRVVASNGTKSGLVTGPAFDIDTRVPADPFGLTAS